MLLFSIRQRHARNMNQIILTTVSKIDYMNPPPGLFFGLLVLGALFTAGVGVAVFSFYVDDYWSDEKFRERLRLHPSRRKKNA